MSFSYTPLARFSEESLIRLMVVPVRRFSYTPHSDHREKFLISSLLACWIGENFLFLLVPDSDRTYVFLIL